MKRLLPFLALLALGCSAAKPQPPAPEVPLRQFLRVPLDCRCVCLLPVKPMPKEPSPEENKTSLGWPL